LVLGQAYALGFVDHRLGGIVGQDAQPGFPQKVQFAVHQVSAEGGINKDVVN
jgi:hypothetical protein